MAGKISYSLALASELCLLGSHKNLIIWGILIEVHKVGLKFKQKFNVKKWGENTYICTAPFWYHYHGAETYILTLNFYSRNFCLSCESGLWEDLLVFSDFMFQITFLR